VEASRRLGHVRGKSCFGLVILNSALVIVLRHTGACPHGTSPIHSSNRCGESESGGEAGCFLLILSLFVTLSPIISSVYKSSGCMELFFVNIKFVYLALAVCLLVLYDLLLLPIVMFGCLSQALV
jgi:hypothetical protein